MNDLKKKILLDLCSAPVTFVPATVGLSMMILSVILGGGLAFFGFCFFLVGVGGFLTNMMFNLNDITNRAVEQLHREKKRDRDAQLNSLDAKLCEDRDSRDQVALRNLRTLYDDFTSDVKENKISAVVPRSMFQQIDNIFDSCIVQLQLQYDIWTTSRKLTGNLKESHLKEKDIILSEVESSVKTLADVINEVRALGLKAHSGDLLKLQQRLNSQLAAAKATENLTKQDDLTRFAEYEKQ